VTSSMAFVARRCCSLPVVLATSNSTRSAFAAEIRALGAVGAVEVGEVGAVGSVGSVGSVAVVAAGLVASPFGVVWGRKALLGTNAPFCGLASVETCGACDLVVTDMNLISTRKIGVFTGVCLAEGINGPIGLGAATNPWIVHRKPMVIHRVLQRFA
jgi:hypothetical protein